jgi:hypothetical protein
MLRVVEGNESAARAAIRRVRDTLEAGLGPDDARALLFDALTQWGPTIPVTWEELNEFVHGPVEKLLGAYMDAGNAPRFMTQLEDALEAEDAGELRKSVMPSITQNPHPASAASTWTMKPIPGKAVRVLLVSSRESIGDMLELALGRDLVKPVLANPLSMISEWVQNHSDVVVVDGVKPPGLEPQELVELLDGASRDVWLAVWGADEPYGEQVTAMLSAADVHCVPVPRKEGIAPFIDLVRARRG